MDAGDDGADAGDDGADASADASAPFSCTSCLELRVPIDNGVEDFAYFGRDFGDFVVDFSAGKVTFRVRAEVYGETVGVRPFVLDGSEEFKHASFEALTVANGYGSDDFQEVTLDLSGEPLPPDQVFDKREVIAFGLEVGAVEGYSDGPQEVVVFLDSITFEGETPEVLHFDFAVGAFGFGVIEGIGIDTAEVIEH